MNGYLEYLGTSPIERPERIAKIVLRPEVSLPDLLEHTGQKDLVSSAYQGLEDVSRLVEIELKYEGYVERETEMVNKMVELESWLIPAEFDYHGVSNITIEARQKLSKIRPDNLGQASRISGVSPADISVLMILLKKYRRSPAASPASS